MFITDYRVGRPRRREDFVSFFGKRNIRREDWAVIVFFFSQKKKQKGKTSTDDNTEFLQSDCLDIENDKILFVQFLEDKKKKSACLPIDSLHDFVDDILAVGHQMDPV